MLGNKNYRSSIEWLALNQTPTEVMAEDIIEQGTGVRLVAFQRMIGVHVAAKDVREYREKMKEKQSNPVSDPMFD